MPVRVPASERPPAACLASDVVRAGLDPLTGRTLSFNHVPMAAWAGHLCDLVLTGRLADVDGTATTAGGGSPLHPLVARAWETLEPALPRPWRLLFGPQVVDVNRIAAETRAWLVEVGWWTRRRTLFGPRYQAVVAPSNDGGTAVEVTRPELRRQVGRSLIAIARFGRSDLHWADDPSDDAFVAALNAVLSSTQDLIAAKAGRPLLLGPGGMQ